MTDFDFYHTYEYHDLIKEHDQESILILYVSGDDKIVFPFLKRSLSKGLYDLTSAYGYLGPLTNSETIDHLSFREEFLHYLKKRKIVSVFSKLNPFMNQQKSILSSMGTIEKVGEVIYYDQNEDSEEQLKKYHRTTGQRLRKLQRIASIKEAVSDEDIGYFVAQYHLSLDRLGANRSFYYPDTYFKRLLNCDFLKAKIYFAIHDQTEEVMGGVFCVGAKKIAQLEIAWTHQDYHKLSPVRLLFDTCRKEFREPFKYLNLGGGPGGREGSLMRFKASFSPHHKEFHVWKLVVLPEYYKSLQTERQFQSNSSYFPKYRLTL